MSKLAALANKTIEQLQIYACSQCGAPNHGLALLSPRQRQVAKGYAAGLRNCEIAEKLRIDKRTVATYKRIVRERLNLENDADWANFLAALRSGKIKS